jgi:hypothetical protein
MKLKVSELIVDFDLYPRAEINTQHAHYMAEALAAGAEFPLIVADQKSKRIVDGVHRHRVYGKALGPDAEIEVHLKSYRNDAEMFIDAMRLNSNHGRALTTFDRTHCILRAEALKISMDQIAASLHLTKDAVGDLRKERVGTMHGPRGGVIALKRTIRHMAGHKLTSEQSDANDRLSGMDQLFYVNQLILLLENDLIDTSNEKLMEGLSKLRDLLPKPLKRSAA